MTLGARQDTSCPDLPLTHLVSRGTALVSSCSGSRGGIDQKQGPGRARDVQAGSGVSHVTWMQLSEIRP